MPPNQGYMMNMKGPFENRPVTTVFVGNICERAPDLMIRNMLQVKYALILNFTLYKAEFIMFCK